MESFADSPDADGYGGSGEEAGIVVVGLGPDARRPTLDARRRRLLSAEAEALRDCERQNRTHVGHFITYGVGAPLLDMRDPTKARARGAVA